MANPEVPRDPDAVTPQPGPTPRTRRARTADAANDVEQGLLTRLLGSRALLFDASPTARLWGWVTTVLITGLAAVLRFADLGRPGTLVFDETYYVKQAYSLLVLGYEGTWPDDANDDFNQGNLDVVDAQADYVVHPPVGKWLIALGMRLAGPEDPASWRLASAVAGTLSVLLLVRIARRLFSSTVLGAAAGLLLAVEGHHIVHSRTGLLDVFLMFFVLAAFGALLLDRHDGRRRLARRCAAEIARYGELSRWGPWLGVRWWRLTSGVLLGLAAGVKWSGLYALVVFGLLTVAWDVTARRTAGVRLWWQAGLLRDGVPAFLAMVPVALLTYLGTWWSWFAHEGAYRRDWAATHPGEGVTWLPESLRSLWKYHADMLGFHGSLTSEHTYAAHPIGWLVQWRPTSFYYESPEPGPVMCGADHCSAAVTSLGNPVIWWLGTIALGIALWLLLRRRDWRAGAVLAGVAAGWVPWLFLAHRTIFSFYSVAFVPFVVLALVLALSLVLGPDDADPVRRRRGLAVLLGVLALCVLVSAFFLPVWTAEVIPYEQWRMRMWFPGWI